MYEKIATIGLEPMTSPPIDSIVTCYYNDNGVLYPAELRYKTCSYLTTANFGFLRAIRAFSSSFFCFFSATFSSA